MSNRKPTQIFTLRNLLTDHCGQILSPDRIDCIMDEIETALESGPCAWAFEGPPNTQMQTGQKPCETCEEVRFKYGFNFCPKCGLAFDR